MIILGISAFFHDSSACLIKDGIIVAAAEEERFTRKKHDLGFPFNAIDYCLKECNATINDIDYIAYYEKPLIKFERILRQFLESFPRGYAAFYKTMPSWVNEKLRVRHIIKRKLKFKGNVFFIEHHLAHAASSYLMSPFDEAAILITDGVGEMATTSLGYARGNEIVLNKEINFPHSLGLLYSTVTVYLGYKANDHEYRCLHPNTPVYLSNGSLIKIESCFNYKGIIKKMSNDEEIVRLNKPIQILSLDKDCLKLRKTKVNEVYRKKANTRLYKVELTSGRSVIVTPNHKFSTTNLNGDYINIEAKDLKKGNFLMIPKVLKHCSNNGKYRYWAYLLAYSIAESNESIRIDKYEAEIRLGCTDQEIIDDFKNITKKLNKNYRVWNCKYRDNMLYIGISVWKDLDFLNNTLKYGFGKKASKKDIPEFVMTSDDETKKGFLRRLFDCDGGFIGHQLIYSSASIKLINSISYLLLEFNIHSKIRVRFNNKYKRDYYRLEISSESLLTFYKEIGLSVKRKLRLLKNYIKNINPLKSNLNIVPINNLLLNEWLKKGFTKESLYSKIKYHFWDYETYKRYTTQQLVKRSYNEIKSTKLKKFIDSEILFDKVKSIKLVKFKGYVYDLLVPNYHTFVGGLGGIILHNTMGLAAYGKPIYYDKLKKLIEIRDDGSYKLNMDYFVYHYKMSMPSKKIIDEFGPIRKKNEEISQRHKDIAASVQKLTEDVLFSMINNLHKTTGMKNLCMAGGVALNSVANGKILRNSGFENIYIQPAAGDGGTSLGAAAYAYFTILNNERKYTMESASLGPSYSNTDIKEYLDKNGIKYSYIADDKELVKKAAKMIYENNVIGWFQGRMEFGPRALGNRSILSNPCNPKMQDILNLKVKHRENYRPYAPVVCADDANDYFECDKKMQSPSDFMLMVYSIKKSKRRLIPAVVHADGSGRLQTIRREQNQMYYDLIKEFGKLSKVPILINTSFNIRGEPIVCKPEDAYKCMMVTEIDYLIMGNFLIARNNNSKDMWNSEEFIND